MDASVEAVDGDTELNLKKFLVEKGGKTLLSMVPITSSLHLLTVLVRDMAQTGAKMLLLLARVKAQKFLIPIRARGKTIYYIQYISFYV